MKKTFLLFFTLLLTLSGVAQIERPKLVVGLVVDQMRWDYLYYYYDQYGSDGIKRLLKQGYSYENMHINYAPTVTAIGHASVYTGSVPAIHGIAGNHFWQDDQPVYCCGDPNVRSVGSNSKEGQMSPHRLLTTTIGDQLKLATDFKSKVFGVALKDRASILPAGHAADAAYWWDTSAGNFVTSTFYMNELPAWVKKFNDENRTQPNYNIKASLEGVTLTFKMAEAILKNENLGKGTTTDLLAVSISPTDIIGHAYGTRGEENKSVYMQMDKDLGNFLTMLDREIGQGNYLLFLTADHGAAHNYNFLNQHRIPAGAWEYKKDVENLNQYLQKKYNIMPVMGEDNYQFYFNDDMIAKASIDKNEIIEASVQFLRQSPHFLYVFNQERIEPTTMPPFLKERMLNGYFRNRSGEIGVVTRPQYFGAKNSPTYRGTSHGQPFPYDNHLPWLMYGWNIPAGKSNQETTINDIAATVCAMLKIQMPNGCIGKVRTNP